MSHVGGNSGTAGKDMPDRRPDGAFRLLTFNLGLLGFGLNRRLRMSLDSEVERRLVAAPALLSAVGADVMALQEVYMPADRQLLIRAMAAQYPFNTGSPHTRSLVGSGLMLLSRFPILQSEFMPCHSAPRWTRLFWNQGLLIVTFDVPGIGRIRLINVHLAASVPFGHSGSAASEANRAREIEQLLSATKGGERPAILTGDFNAGPEAHADSYHRVIKAGYADAFVGSPRSAATDPGFTWDAANPLNVRGRFRGSPSQRIDHVFVSGTGSPSLMPTSARIVLQERIISTTSGTEIPLSDHYGMLVTLAASQTG